MSTPLTFEIEFQSDYHIGAGHGSGQRVDSALLRDADNVPVIRGTVLAGLLRESLVNLLQLQPLQKYKRHEVPHEPTGELAYCNKGTATEGDVCPVCAIFGSPRQLKRWQISSARPVGVEAPLLNRNEWQRHETAAQVTTRVRVNPRTRRAEENKLFTREEGDGRLHFRFTVTCISSDEAVELETEWLVVAARMLRNLGAGKHRGYGECSIHLVDRKHEKQILERFGDRLNGKKLEQTTIQAAPSAAKLQVADANTAHKFRVSILLRTDEPLLIARRAEAGNQFETLESIPGSVVRGAFAWRIAERARKAMESATSIESDNFRTLFFSGAVRFSTMTPIEVSLADQTQGYHTIPTPRDLQTCELHRGYALGPDDGHGVWSLLQSELPQDEVCPWCRKADPATQRQGADVKLESLGGFISLVDSAPRSNFQPKQTVEMHIRLDPQSGRVRQGDLYGYVSLEPGQYFAGEISCTDKVVWQVLREMAGFDDSNSVHELRLGKASRRGHGKTSIVFEEVAFKEREGSQSPWLGPALKNRVQDESQFTMLLLSDAIITDPWGRFERGFAKEWIARALGLSVDAVKIDEEKRFSATRNVDAFNAKLGLPRARDIAIVAGSCVRVNISGIDLGTLQNSLLLAEADGIGLRREEGFGRVAFNHPIYEKLTEWGREPVDLSPLVLKRAGDKPEVSISVINALMRWMKELDTHREPLSALTKDGRFQAVARLLHASEHLSSPHIMSALERLGEMDELLPNKLKGRDKDNFFQKDGKAGIEKIRQLLQAFEKLLSDHGLVAEPQAWRMGLRMLADRIALASRKSE